jgi:uncharacterized membrane protein YraQ (UPF0718 family)
MMARIAIDAAGMFWQMFWALVVGFSISGFLQAFVSPARTARLLGGDSPRQIGLAALLGAASSSCSFAAAAIARTLFGQGAHITTALAFLLASTNLVLELGIVLWQLMGWRFVAAEMAGGICLVAIFALLMRVLGPVRAFEKRRAQPAAPGAAAACCHAGSPATPAPPDRWTAAARAFIAEWRMLGRDIALGVGVSAVVMNVVPESVWRILFLPIPPGPGGWAARLEHVLAGPLVAVLSFVCSIGNVPIAHALYARGVSFGGTLAFLYADLISFPLLLVYRRDYGWKLALQIAGLFYLAMATSAWLIETLFSAAGLAPAPGAGHNQMAGDPFAGTTTAVLNIAGLGVCLAMAIRARRAAPTPAGHCH